MIVGAGAAGLMAAIHCARQTPSGVGQTEAPRTGPDVLVVESTRDGGRKILISGGGRCNILPSDPEESRFVTDSSRNTMKKMLRSWPLAELRRFFEEELGIPLTVEPETGKLFPKSNRARDVRDALVAAARARGVRFLFETKIIAAEHAAPRWTLRTSRGDTVEASAVILATGGLSVPNTGSDGTGLMIARALDHEETPTYAALTPLVCDPPRFQLAGVSLDVRLASRGPNGSVRTSSGFLFTHRGYSGPAVLDLSHLAVRSTAPRRALPSESSASHHESGPDARQKIFVQWCDLGEGEWKRVLAPRKAGALGAVRAHLPERLAEALFDEARVPRDRTLAELRTEERRRLVEALTRFELPWTGHEGYRTAEVTGGGIALSEIDPRTMESRRWPGLYLCGEMLDAFGPIGGYNFLWAWATGRAAGIASAVAWQEIAGSIAD